MVAVLKKTKHSKSETVKGDASLQKKCAFELFVFFSLGIFLPSGKMM